MPDGDKRILKGKLARQQRKKGLLTRSRNLVYSFKLDRITQMNSFLPYAASAEWMSFTKRLAVYD